MRSSFDAMHEETRTLRLLEPDPEPTMPMAAKLLTALLVVVPIVLAFVL